MKQKWNDISPWCWTCATRHSKFQREMNAWKSCICTSVCSVWLEMLCEILQPRGTQSKEAVLSLTTGCVTCFCFWALVSPCRWTFIPHIPSTVFKSVETLCFSVQCRSLIHRVCCQWTVFVTWWTRLQSDSLIFKYFIVLWLFTDGWHRRHVQRPAGGDGPPHSGEFSHDSSLNSALHFTPSDFLCSLSELFITHYFLLVIYFRSISLLLAHYSILIFKKANLNQMFHLWFIILLH